jgi:hypothetical protein
VLSSVLPRQWERDAASAAGSTWDAASAVSDLAAGGLRLGVFGVWTARITIVGSLVYMATSLVAVCRARDRAGRVFAATQAAGYGLTTAGLLTAGDGLIVMGAATAEIPPLGLALCAAGAGLLVASYCYRYRTQLGRALDLAWRVQAAPVRYGLRAGARAVHAIGGAAGAALDAGRSALDALNPF